MASSFLDRARLGRFCIFYAWSIYFVDVVSRVQQCADHVQLYFTWHPSCWSSTQTTLTEAQRLMSKLSEAESEEDILYLAGNFRRYQKLATVARNCLCRDSLTVTRVADWLRSRKITNLSGQPSQVMWTFSADSGEITALKWPSFLIHHDALGRKHGPEYLCIYWTQAKSENNSGAMKANVFTWNIVRSLFQAGELS